MKKTVIDLLNKIFTRILSARHRFLIISSDKALAKILCDKCLHYFPNLSEIQVKDKASIWTIFFRGTVWMPLPPSNIYEKIIYQRQLNVIKINPDTLPTSARILATCSLFDFIGKMFDSNIENTNPFLVFEKDYIENKKSFYHLDNNIRSIVESSLERLKAFIEKKRQGKSNKSYVFGTGPSLDALSNFDIFQDGFKIVSNSFLKDKETWQKLQPDVICAIDSVHYFGNSISSKLFLYDTNERLLNSDCIFIYPLPFHSVVLNHIEKNNHHKCIPIPYIHEGSILSLKKYYGLPVYSNNSLDYIALPIACLLSENIYLYGYDGSSPVKTKEAPLWTNADRYSYKMYEKDIIKVDKGYYNFFKHDMPSDAYMKLLEEVYDKKLTAAEQEGYFFTMMHDSYYQSLNKRKV